MNAQNTVITTGGTGESTAGDDDYWVNVGAAIVALLPLCSAL